MSLLKELCDLANTAPVLADPEDDIHEESKAKVLEDFVGDYEEVGVGTIRRHQPLSIKDPKYADKKVSRKELEKQQFGDSDTGSSSEEVDEEERVSVPSSEGSAAESGPEDDVEDDAEAEEEEIDEGSEYEVDEQECAEESDDKDEKHSDIEDDMVQKFSAVDVAGEVEKGRAVQSQLQLWDSLLELRIQLQKLLFVANRFPQHDRYGEFRRALLSQDKKQGRALAGVAKSVESIFLELLDLQEQTVGSHQEISSQLGSTRSRRAAQQLESDDEEILSDTEEEQDEGKDDDNGDDEEEERPRKKRRISDAIADVASFHQEFVPVRNAIIEKWYQRTRLASGKVGKGFSAFEQSPLKQIEHILADEPRLILRTQTKRSAYKILGATPDGQDEEVPSVGTKETNEEIFDDDDFYHHLLREVIERKTANVDNPVALSRQWLEIQKLRSKVKRKVDTKASKGRRTRYVVIPKLVNFMAPVDTATYSEDARTELFSSLFGQKKYARQPMMR